MSMRDGNLWTIKMPSGFLYDKYVYYTRSESIKAFMEDMGCYSWRWFKARGYKCVGVNLVELEAE